MLATWRSGTDAPAAVFRYTLSSAESRLRVSDGSHSAETVAEIANDASALSQLPSARRSRTAGQGGLHQMNVQRGPDRVLHSRRVTVREINTPGDLFLG
jgi:hypothetical protein